MSMTIEQTPMSALVRRVWEQVGMTGMTPAQREQFLAAETARLEDLVELATPDPAELTRLYTKKSGHSPDYLTMVGLITNAQTQAQTLVLEQELYCHLPPPDDEPTVSVEEAAQRRLREDQARLDLHRGDPNRWQRALHRSEPTGEIVALTRSLWGDRSARFRVLAQYLLQARSEDQQPIPTSPGPLFRQFTSLLENELRSRGHAADATEPR